MYLYICESAAPNTVYFFINHDPCLYFMLRQWYHPVLVSDVPPCIGLITKAN